MGSINIEGLGIVEIEGDIPNEAEQNAILNAISADEGDPEVTFQEEVIAEPESPEELVESPKKPREGPLGIIPPDVREPIRSTIEEQPGLVQLLAEIGPSVGGALVGATRGSPFGLPGVIGGAIIGGLGGELLAQETGVAPESKLNLALSAAGPVAGPAVGTSFRLARRIAGFVSTKIPFAATARSRNIVSEVVEEFESLGTRILEKAKGLISRPSGDLYDAVRRAGVIVPKKSLDGTRSAINKLLDEMDAFKAFPEVEQSMKVLRQMTTTLDEATDISMDTLVRTRQLLGVVIKRAESGGGIKLGSSKKAFSAISDDLDRIAADPSLTGRAARLAKAAVKRAKLEFAVKDVERAVAQFTKDTATKDGVVINIIGLQKWFRAITNPKSKQFSKNFTNALKDDIPAIKERLVSLAKIIGTGGPGGPGSLIIRGRLTSITVGAMAGVGLGGPIGGAVGALVGTNIPEMLTGILMSKTGAKFLERAAQLGKGQINMRTWIAAGEIAIRSLGEGSEAVEEPFAKAL